MTLKKLEALYYATAKVQDEGVDLDYFNVKMYNSLSSILLGETNSGSNTVAILETYSEPGGVEVDFAVKRSGYELLESKKNM